LGNEHRRGPPASPVFFGLRETPGKPNLETVHWAWSAAHDWPVVAGGINLKREREFFSLRLTSDA